jgi:type 1 glutamine amidotransferase
MVERRLDVSVMSLSRVCGIVMGLLALAGVCSASDGELQPIRALLLTGQNNHHWRYTSRFHAETLEATGRFEVSIADDPAKALTDAKGLDDVQLFIVDYNGQRWGREAEANFVAAVERGAGVVLIHAANNAFLGERGIGEGSGVKGDPGWVEYQKMCGPMWVNGTTGHGRFHRFAVRMVHPTHPVVSGLPDMTNHPDELYHQLVNVQNVKYDLLATALSTGESGGTGLDEPMAMALQVGQGRIFHTPLGHVWAGAHDQKYSIADPQFKVLLARGAEWAATGRVTIGAAWEDRRAHNVLREADRENGWTLLFDGTKATGLRAHNNPSPGSWPGEGWSIEHGMIRHHAGKGGGDLVTVDEYADFEFSIDWKVALGGNSGLMYRVKEVPGQPTYLTGPEMQILDNEKHRDAGDPKTSAGALYAMIACSVDVIRPAGEWNQFMIRVKGDAVEHWANGYKVVDYRLNSPEWEAMVAGAKFKDWKEFGRQKIGRIAIQDHGDDVWYRNIKVRRLK